MENKISDLENRIEQMNDKEKKYENAKETLGIINKIIDYNNNGKFFFHRGSKVDKKKSEPKIEESFVERVQLKNNMIAKIKKEEKNIDNLLFRCYFIKYQNPSDMYKKLREAKGNKNEDQVYSIKKVLDQIKNSKKSAKEYMIEKETRYN